MLEEFYKSVEDIFLFLGNISELNELKYDLPQYVLLGREYIYGIIIPSKKDISEICNAIALLQPDNFPAGFTTELEDKIMPLYANPEFLKLDLRVKAKDRGADGLIHVRYHNENWLNIVGITSRISYHVGLPVIRRF